MNIDKITDFVLSYAMQYTTQPKELCYAVIKKHLEYKTIIVFYDNPEDQNIVAVCRWNVEGDTAYILDLIIAPKYRKIGLRLMKFMLRKGLEMYPCVTQLKWQRATRDDKVRVFSIYQLLKEKQLQEV